MSEHAKIAQYIRGTALDHSLSVRALASKMAVPPRSLQNVLDGKEPRVDRAAEICRALGLEFYIGPPRGESLAEPPALETPLAPAIPPAITDMLGLPEGADAGAVVSAIRKALAGQGTAAASPVATLDTRMERTLDSKLTKQTRSLESKLDALAERLSPLDAGMRETQKLELRQVTDVRSAAGFGEEIFEEGATATLIVAADDIPPGLNTERLIGIKAVGHSMEPTICDDDILVLNLDAKEPKEGAIFVVRTDTGLVVKRLSKKEGAWTMTSDAGDWGPRPVAESDRIIGHVVWFGPEGAIVIGEGQ